MTSAPNRIGAGVDWLIADLVHRRGEMDFSKIVRETGCPKSTVSRAIRRLANREVVSIYAHRSDARRLRILPGPLGAESVPRAPSPSFAIQLRHDDSVKEPSSSRPPEVVSE